MSVSSEQAKGISAGWIVAAAVILAVLAGGLIWSDAESQQARYERRAQHNAKQYADSASEHAQRACVGVTAAERYKCVHEQHHGAWQRQREEYDLQAQLSTATWTRAMGFAALIGMAVGILGVGLVYVTFRETRRAAGAARDTYNAFVAAEDASLIVEFGGHVIQVGADGPFHDEYAMNASIENIGQATAHIDRCVFSGKSFRANYPLERGRKYALDAMLPLENDEPFELDVHYSTPLRPAVILTVTAEPFKLEDAPHKARALIRKRRLRFPEQGAEEAKKP